MHQEKLSTIFNSASTAIIVLTPEQEIIFSNSAAARLFGYPNLTGTYMPDLFYPDDYLIIQTFLQDLEYKKQISKSIHTTGNHKNGRKLPLRITLKRISGLSSYYIALIKSETSAVPELFQQRTLPLLYQEILTSLDTLTSATQSLLNIAPSHEQSIYLKLIESSGEHLRRTFCDAFTHSRKDTIFEFRKIVDGIKKVYKKQAEMQSISLRLLIEEDIPRMLKGDPEYLEQFLHYLLSQLFMHSIQGSIFIQIYLHQELHSAQVLLFKTTCTNTGITYFQANDIIKKLNEINQDVEPQPVKAVLDYHSEHSTVIHLFFTFTTPGLEEPMVMNKNPPALLKKPLLKGLKVLYVDDVTSNQLLMEGLCHHWGVQLDSAFSGTEALEKIHHIQYNVILMDLYMPDMDGFETVYHIRNSSQQTQTPILAVSASVSEDAQSRASSIGMDGFITKPINPDLLFQKLAPFLK